MMSYEDIRTVSEYSYPTDKVLKWMECNPHNTITKLRMVLENMGRGDCVSIIDQGPQSGMYRCFV